MELPEFGEAYRFSPISNKDWSDKTWEEVWNACLKNDCICFGYGWALENLEEVDLEDLQSASDQKYIRTFLKIRPNDLIIANRGTNQVLAVGVVKDPPYTPQPAFAKQFDRSRQPHNFTWNHVLNVRWLPDSAGKLPDKNGIKWTDTLSPITSAINQLPGYLRKLSKPLGTNFPTGKTKDVGYDHTDTPPWESDLDLENILVAKIEHCPWRWRRTPTPADQAYLRQNAKMSFVRANGDLHESRNFDPDAAEDGYKYFFMHTRGVVRQRFKNGRGLVFWLSTNKEVVGLSAWCELAEPGGSFEPDFDNGKDRKAVGLKGNWQFNLRCPDDPEHCWCEFAVPVPVDNPIFKKAVLGEKDARRANYFKLTPLHAAETLLDSALKLQDEAITNSTGEDRLRAEQAWDVIDWVSTHIGEMGGYEGSDMSRSSSELLMDQVRNQLFERSTHAVILQGPAGTGKTWMTKKIASQYREDGGLVRSTQFHPAYTYEDFIEGLRPQVDEQTKQLKYVVQDGVFKKLCSEARQQPDKDHLFIIDEINRGNIAKIFGEVMQCIEYRNDEGEPEPENQVLLPYSQEPLVIPSNVHILATMNTSDRSIAMLDIALRRRFSFVTVSPDPEHVRGTKISYGGETAELGELLTALNAFLEKSFGNDRLIGHSYLMSPDEVDGEGLFDWTRRVWFFQIVPLLQEYFFDDERQLEPLLCPEFATADGQWRVFSTQEVDDEEFVAGLARIASSIEPNEDE